MQRTEPELNETALLLGATMSDPRAWGPLPSWRGAMEIGGAPYGGKGCGFKCRMTVPSETVGAAAPVPRAFLAIQSRAARVLSSVPSLVLQTVTENPPLDVRTSE